jgi:hypothetical protein
MLRDDFAGIALSLPLWTAADLERPHGAIGQMTPIMLLNAMAQPARHSERAEKLYPPAIQSSASLHEGTDSAQKRGHLRGAGHTTCSA